MIDFIWFLCLEVCAKIFKLADESIIFILLIYGYSLESFFSFFEFGDTHLQSLSSFLDNILASFSVLLSILFAINNFFYFFPFLNHLLLLNLMLFFYFLYFLYIVLKFSQCFFFLMLSVSF